MTNKELKKLTPAQKRICIALKTDWYLKSGGPEIPIDLPEETLQEMGIPDYFNDLNACAKMEKALSPEDAPKYRLRLMMNSDGAKATHPTVEAALAHATAPERCNAFLRTVG